VTGTVSSIVRARARGLWHRARGRELEPEMLGWLAELERRHGHETVGPQRPHYTIASSTARRGLEALTAPQHLSEECKDFMVACDPRRAVAASTAVPFVLRPVTGIGPEPGEAWFDGSIRDENPLALPYVKWVRERAARPDVVPPRLKIILVNLNLRASESELLRRMMSLPGLRGASAVEHGFRVLDMLLDSKTSTNIRIVTALPTVEVMSIKLELGWMNVQNPRDIPKAVRTGRTMDCWQIHLHGASGKRHEWGSGA